jgi:hypothetical protein
VRLLAHNGGEGSVEAKRAVAKVNEAKTRQKLAFWIVGIGLASVTLISALVIGFATPDGRPEASRLVFTSVLPLLGTWVGTVLAFYFARENFEAATQSTIRLGRSLRPETPVREVMIPRADITAHVVSTRQAADAVALTELLNNIADSGRQRVPILTAGDQAVYVVHSSTLSAFAASVQKFPDQLTETVSDLVNDPEFNVLVTAIGFVSVHDLVETARAEMASIPNCNDVFVTADGSATGAVQGWLTNTDLAGLA